jgi:hypothetical protein
MCIIGAERMGRIVTVKDYPVARMLHLMIGDEVLCSGGVSRLYG